MNPSVKELIYCTDWKLFLDSSWKTFEARFRAILDNLSQHARLVMNEAHSLEIEEADTFRIQAKKEIKSAERDRASWQLRETFSWLGVDEDACDQENELASYLGKKHPNTCRWIFETESLKDWMKDSKSDVPCTLWLEGKIGSGGFPAPTFGSKVIYL